MLGDYLTIVAFFVLTFADQVMTALWAWRLGPQRAQKLVIASFKDPTTAGEVREALDIPTRTDLMAIRHDFEAHTDRIMKKALNPPLLDVKTPIRESMAPILAEVSALRAEVVALRSQPSAPVIMTADMEDRIRKSIERAAKAAIKVAVEDGEFMPPLPEPGELDALGGQAIADAVEANRMANILVDRGIMTEKEADFITQKGVRAARIGLNLLAAKYDIDLEGVF